MGLSLKSENVYRDIVPNRRIIFTSTMAVADKCISVSLGTVDCCRLKGHRPDPHISKRISGRLRWP